MWRDDGRIITELRQGFCRHDVDPRFWYTGLAFMIGCVANPLFLFLGVWAVVGVLYAAGVSAGTLPAPRAQTVGLLLLNVVAFSLGYLTWSLSAGLKSPGRDLLRRGIQPLTPRRMRRALTFTLLMGAAAFLLMLYRVAVIAAHSKTSFLNLLGNPNLLRFLVVQFIEMGAVQVSPLTMLISLTNAFFAVGFVLLGVFLCLDRTAWRYAYLLGFLLVAFAACLINLSRYDMVVSVLYLVLAYCVTSASVGGAARARLVRDLLPPVAAVAAIFVVVELLLRKSATYGPAGTWRSVLLSFYWYLASPAAAFNEFLASFPGGYSLGEKTFAPVFKWLYRFHLAAQPTVTAYGEFVWIPYPANTYTYLRNFYEDFGILGVALVPYTFGALSAAIKNRAGRYFPFLNLYVFLLVPIIFSFYCYPLLSSQFYLQLLFGFLFFRYALPTPTRPAPLRAVPRRADGIVTEGA
jgi:oligosaccharide repeat unit polymerase